MSTTYAMDTDRPKYRDYFRHLAFWAYPFEAFFYDMNARPFFTRLYMLTLGFTFGVRYELVPLVLLLVCAANLADAKFNLFPYTPRAGWTAHQEQWYVRSLRWGRQSGAGKGKQ